MRTQNIASRVPWFYYAHAHSLLRNLGVCLQRTNLSNLGVSTQMCIFFTSCFSVSAPFWTFERLYSNNRDHQNQHQDLYLPRCVRKAFSALAPDSDTLVVEIHTFWHRNGPCGAEIYSSNITPANASIHEACGLLLLPSYGFR